ncbi:Retrovirus-related Pol polyprotein from transposon TNT 1-94, partial [Gonioctena quinquepunctata]
VHSRNGKRLIIVLYVDDGLTVANEKHDLEDFMRELESEFRITWKSAVYYLGLEIDQREDGSIKISQNTHARKILERLNFSDCKPISTPMLKEREILETGKESKKVSNFPYRQAVGALMYLMLGTRPDLAYSIGFLSRSLENPTAEDVAKVKRVSRYIAGTLDLGIIYRPNFKRGTLECYSDADFGGCTKTGRSTSGVIMIHAGGAISWLSQRQAMVATSTTEAEIVAANEATKEIIWLSRLFEGIIGLKHVPILQVDNSAAVRLAQNPEFHRRTKHISIKYFFIEKIRRKIGCSTNTHRRTDRRHDDKEFTKTTSSNIMQSNRIDVILNS